MKRVRMVVADRGGFSCNTRARRPCTVRHTRTVHHPQGRSSSHSLAFTACYDINSLAHTSNEPSNEPSNNKHFFTNWSGGLM